MLSPEHHIRRDFLSRPVRDYADKLQAELRDILRQYHIHTPDDLKRLAQEKKIPEQVVRQYKDLITRLSEVVRSGKLPDDYPVVEYKEHTLDINEVLKASRDFYQSHNLSELADALPDTLGVLTDAQRERVQFALEQGFTSALILPPPDLLQEKLDDLIEECANKPSDRLTGKNQYARAIVYPEAKSTPRVDRPASAYLLLYSSGPLPKETRDRTADDLIALFQKKFWDGLTLTEYLLLQRIEAEKNANHAFDVISNTAEKSNWTFLLDSRSSNGVVRVNWTPPESSVLVFWGDDYSKKRPHLGARPAVVVPLK